MKQIVRKLVAVLYRFICKIGWINPSKVVIMEGGICSQILWYYEGVRCCPSIEAEFDMSFYEDGGKDILGNDNRPFELLNMFPDLPFKICDKKKARFYRRYLKSRVISPPVYMNNYQLRGNLNNIHSIFNLNRASIPKSKEQLMKTLRNEHSCGIHIRRGDLINNDNPYYGKFSEDYIIRAMDYVKRIDAEVSFYAFSDDNDWVKAIFMEKCGHSLNLMEGNSGGEDLILLASCHYIIASQGTAGRLAALINGDSLLIMQEGDPHNLKYLNAHKSCVLLS